MAMVGAAGGDMADTADMAWAWGMALGRAITGDMEDTASVSAPLTILLTIIGPRSSRCR